MFSTALCVLVSVAIANGRVLYDGTSVQTCNPKYPCPIGSTCMYSRKVPGTKACFRGVTNVQKHPGRCPAQSFGSNSGLSIPNTSRFDRFGIRGSRFNQGGSRFNQGGQQCDFDADCPMDQRCCASNSGGQACVRSQSISPAPTVTTLIEGSMRPTNQGFEFVGSVALVQSNGFNVLFDTGNAVDQIELLDKLRQMAGIYPEDIDYIVTSHGHPDHYVNVALFPDVPNNFDSLTATGNGLAGNPPAPLYLNGDPNLEIIKTPGHTLQDTSLIVRNVPGRGTVILSGDIFLSGDDYMQPLQGEDMQKLSDSRTTIACTADYVIPGHGPMFPTLTIRQQYNC